MPKVDINWPFQVGLFGWSGVTIRSSSPSTIYNRRKYLLTNSVCQLYLGKHYWDILTTVGEKEYYYKVDLPLVCTSYTNWPCVYLTSFNSFRIHSIRLFFVRSKYQYCCCIFALFRSVAGNFELYFIPSCSLLWLLTPQIFFSTGSALRLCIVNGCITTLLTKFIMKGAMFVMINSPIFYSWVLSPLRSTLSSSFFLSVRSYGFGWLSDRRLPSSWFFWPDWCEQIYFQSW